MSLLNKMPFSGFVSEERIRFGKRGVQTAKGLDGKQKAQSQKGDKGCD